MNRSALSGALVMYKYVNLGSFNENSWKFWNIKLSDPREGSTQGQPDLNILIPHHRKLKIKKNKIKLETSRS